MQALSNTTNLSNWTLSLVLGAAAALKSGAQQGMEGELPFCDVLLILSSLHPWFRRDTPSGDNVFIGFDSIWARIMLKTFQARRLKFVSLLLKDDGPRHPTCHCHMAPDPSEQSAESEAANKKDVKSASYVSWLGIQPFLMGRSGRDLLGVHYGKNTSQIRPNMFYGLIDEHTSYDNKLRRTYLVVHRPSCIPAQLVDKRAIEFQPPALTDMLNKSVNNQDAKDKCKKLINIMGEKVNTCKKANEWDTGIIGRIYDLMKFPWSEQESVSLNETMDRIHSRIPEMLERLHLTTFHMDGDDYTIKDVSRACVVYFGILRAIFMSGLIYGEQDHYEETAETPEASTTQTNSNRQGTSSTLVPSGIQRTVTSSTGDVVVTVKENGVPKYEAKKPEMRGLVFMGYNIKVGHEMIRDIVEVPTLSGMGYSSVQLIEDTHKERIIVDPVEFSSIFITSIVLDLALSVAIMLLSGIGPLLSMYTARLVTSPYRESYLKMGTSMRWAVGEVSMFHSGTARDDWMVGITPVQNKARSILIFFLMALASSIIPVVLWATPLPLWNQFRYDSDGQNNLVPGTLFGHLISILGCVVGVAWVLLSLLNHKKKSKPRKATRKASKASLSDKVNGTAKEDDDSGNKQESSSKYWTPKLLIALHIIVNILLTMVPVVVVYSGVTVNWVYLYLLEAVYFFQWLYGEVFSRWEYESTGLFMAGVIGAIRLNSID